LRKRYDWTTIKDVLMISDGMIHEVTKKYKLLGMDESKKAKRN